MSTHSSSAPVADQGPKRLKPHQLVIGIGIAMGVFILASGVLPLITGWHNENAVHREVFGNIPGPLKIAFYTVMPAMIVWGAFVFADRVKNWERGVSDRRRLTPKNAKKRLGDFRAGVYMQTLLRDSAAGLMHSFIYFGFLGLLGITTTLEVDHQLPRTSSSCTATSTAPTHSWAICSASCSWSASCGRSSAGTCSARIASASRPSPNTP